MQLGSILSAGMGEPIVDYFIEFYLMTTTAEGQKRTKVKAKFMPVSEKIKVKAYHEALQFLKTDPSSPYRKVEGEPEMPIPDYIINREEIVKYLSFALYDAEDPKSLLVGPLDYPIFRAALTADQVPRLYKEYRKFIAQEYPEVITKAEREALFSEALGK